MSGRAPAPRAVAAHAKVELVQLLRSGESLLVTFGLPLSLLVFLALADILPVAFLVPGTLAISVMAAGLVSLAIATGFERKYGVLKLLSVAPLPPGGLVAGKAAALLALLALQAILTVSVGAALGWRFGGSVVAALLALLLGGVAFGAIGLLLAGTLRAEGTLAAANGLFVVLVAVSGIAYPLERGPDGLAAIARVLPSGALGAALRAALDAPGTFAVGALLVLLAWAVVAVVAAARWARWEP